MQFVIMICNRCIIVLSSYVCVIYGTHPIKQYIGGLEISVNYFLG